MKVERVIIAVLVGFVLLLEGCSCHTWTSAWGGDSAEKCADHWHWKKQGCEVAEAPPPAMPAYNPCAAPRMVETERVFPSSQYMGQAVRVTKVAPEQVVLNEPFDVQLKVTNITDQDVINVMVNDVQSPNLKIVSSEPEMIQKEGQVRWVLGALGPNESKTIYVKAMAIEMGTITTCAQVTYDTPTCAQIMIVQPELRLAKYAPSQSLACDRIPLKYTIENTGTGYACDISITDTLPEGMMTSEGRREVKFALDSLGPNESRDFEIMVDASKPGQFSSAATAVARTGGSAQSNIADTMVTQPVLEISETGFGKQYLGRPATFTITVTNKGNAVAQDTVVETTMPSGARFSSASEGGSMSGADKVVWNIGDLQPQASRKLTLNAMMDQPGKLMTRASVRAYCADAMTAAAETQIVGVPGILLEVVDVADPIEIGQTETYTISVTNQGTAADTGIRVVCQLEDGMEYITSSGPTQGTIDGQRITFAPLASLAPRANAVWKVNVKAAGTGDMRFKVQMNSDQLGDRPVQESEATRFYGPMQ